jgi:Family of unknown function (DUF6216)
MDSQQVVTGISQISGLSPAALNVTSFILFCAALLWICRQAGSFRPVIYRVWRMITTEPSKYQSTIHEAVDREDWLSDFRVRTGLRVDSLPMAENLSAWVLSHSSESFRSIRATGRIFDLEKCQLNLKRMHGVVAESILLLLWFLAVAGLAFSLIGMVSGKSWLSFKSTGTHFLLTKEAAKRFPVRQWQPLNPADCKAQTNDLVSNTGFSSEELSDLCRLFQDAKFDSWVDRSIDNQKSASTGLALSMSWFAFFCYTGFVSNRAARQMRRRLGKAMPD